MTWLKTNRPLNKMCVRVGSLYEMEDCRCDATHLPGSRNPTDPLSRRGSAASADGNSPAVSTGDPDLENQPEQELFSHLGRAGGAPSSAALAIRVNRARWRRPAGWTTRTSRRGISESEAPRGQGGGFIPHFTV